MTTRQPGTDDVTHLRKQTSAYVAILKEQIEIRRREYGYKWVTPREHAWLTAHGLLPQDVLIAQGGSAVRQVDAVARQFNPN
jgi:hypothetical protein